MPRGLGLSLVEAFQADEEAKVLSSPATSLLTAAAQAVAATPNKGRVRPVEDSREAIAKAAKEAAAAASHGVKNTAKLEVRNKTGLLGGFQEEV